VVAVTCNPTVTVPVAALWRWLPMVSIARDPTVAVPVAAFLRRWRRALTVPVVARFSPVCVCVRERYDAKNVDSQPKNSNL
jgi:hypothetical protein